MSRKRYILAMMWLVALTTVAAPSPQFVEDCAALTKAPHRLTGSEEYRAAAEYAERRLRELGADAVIVQEYAAAQTEVRLCELVVPGDRVLPLEPMRANGIVPPVTPPGGITGVIVHVGAGTFEDMRDLDVQDRIVVMDYNCGNNWLRAFRLGAKAVVFVTNAPPESWHPHYVQANANLPRYFFAGQASMLSNGMAVAIHSEIVWRRVTGRNVLGLFKGTNPEFYLGKKEAMVIAAHLDSYGEVPRCAPGARAAANCAGLLEIAGQLGRTRPRRDVVIAFFDGESRGASGVGTFYATFEERTSQERLERRIESFASETNFLSQTIALARSDNPLAGAGGGVQRDFVNNLHELAEGHAFELRGRLKEVRAELRGAPMARVDVLKARIADIEAEKDRWNTLLRDLDRNRVSPQVTGEFSTVLAEMRQHVLQRETELAADQRSLAASARLKALLKDHQIVLHISLLAGDSSARWGVVTGGDSDYHSYFDMPGLYSRVLRTFAQENKALAAKGRPLIAFESATVDGGLITPRAIWAAPVLLHSGELAGQRGVYNAAFVTAHEWLPREGTPGDTIGMLDLAAFGTVFDDMARLLGAACSADGLSQRSSITPAYEQFSPAFDNGRPTTAMLMGRRPGTSMPNMPMKGSVLEIYRWETKGRYFIPQIKAYGADQYQVHVSDQNGAYGPMLFYSWPGIHLAYAAGFDAAGRVVESSDMVSRETFRERMNMFPCNDIAAVLPPLFMPKEVRFLNARGNGNLSSPGSEEAYAMTEDGVAFCRFDTETAQVKAFAPNALVALNNDPASGRGPDRPEYGIGFPIGQAWTSMRTAAQSAHDLWRLNEARLVILQSRNIVNSSVQELHSRAKDLIDASGTGRSPIEREALAAAGFMGAEPVYLAILSTLNDLVKAALILLGLAVPFAFALERLLFCSATITRQATWFAILFLATFAVLYVSHPAFAVAQTPIIVLLGFAVITLSVLVVVILMQRFESELKLLQGQSTTVHSADVSRFGTVMAAMAMGMSTMRRRPLRTTLTAVTIILLTFTILCFASFDTQRGIVRVALAPSPAYTGVLLHKADWTGYNNELFDVVKGRWGRSAAVCPRIWLCPELKDSPGFVIARADGTQPIILKGMLGIAQEEVARRGDLRKLLGLVRDERIDGRVVVSEAVAQQLGCVQGDTVIVNGQRLKLGKPVGATALSAACDMDGNSILPVDFVQMKPDQGIAAAEAEAPVQSGDVLEEQKVWTRLQADTVVVVPVDIADRCGGKLHAATIYADDAARAGAIAEDLARMLDKTPVVVTLEDGVYRLIHTTVVAASGLAGLFFPLLLGGLVIFGTMLSSVADREKEIYTFSALGLAPPHVASLFFAEALVYAVLGGMGGYLLAQCVMKGFDALATLGLVTVPEMNYSSMNAIVTILIVMAVVLISAIYPAITASRSANPGLLRSWRLPKPEGDVFTIVFPFTVSEYDLTGVVSFLKEHFDSFSDTGLGCFMARHARLVRHADGAMGVAAELALAPFDLGVTQSFELRSMPSEIAGIDEVVLTLTRRSGQPRDWVRLNKVLLGDLRTQFLLWRSLPHQSMETYRNMTLDSFGTVAGREAQGNA